ncbi:MAG: KpsF/GutQ family sugar-phosphate isomerase [Candidatus Ancaeobacter aquaticus]|nr:KpsF/GutQ family sugar-phosphate isomerase [Candidatus Ancaeobacter aquaticus]
MSKAMQTHASIDIALNVLEVEAQAIESLMKHINGDFEKAIELLLSCRGRVIVTGMGKPGIIGRKISATLASTGTPSLWLHPAEAIHGDLGMVMKDDIIIAISNSGETEEIRKLLPTIKKIGTRLISFTGNLKSTLAEYSDVAIYAGVEKEACPYDLVPTASTVVALALGDAIAIVLMQKRGFRVEEYAFYHPGGTLGKRMLLKVEDIMRTGTAIPLVSDEMRIKEVLFAITDARAGAAIVIDANKQLVGIFTDGDLRRSIEKEPNVTAMKVSSFMTKRPITITQDKLAMEALRIIKERRIDELIVVDKDGHPIGIVDEKDLLGLG